MKTFDGYKKRNLTDKDYALLAGGGHKALDTLFSALSSDTTNAIKITVGGTEKSISTSTLKTSLGLGSNAYTSTAYLPLAGGTMTGALNFKNGTWNLMGDDAYIGDCNVAGMIGIKGANAATPGFVLYDNSGTLLGKLYASNDTLNWSGGTIAATIFSGSAECLNNYTISDPNTQALKDNKVKWFAQINRTSNGSSSYAGNNYGFPVANNANGILYLGTHPGKYGHQLGFSSNGNIYHRYQNGSDFPQTANGGSWSILLTSTNYAYILDNRYYTETEADNRFVNVTGDTMTGPIKFSYNNNGNCNVSRGSGFSIFYGNQSNATDYGFPFQYSSVVSFMTGYCGMQFANYGGNGDYRLLFRNISDGDKWTAWYTLLHSGNSSVSGGGSTWGSSITVKINGTSKTLTIPSNPNTDENVKQVPKTDNVNRPLMMINGSTSAGEQINTSMFSTGIYANASTKMITANGFIKAGSSDTYFLLGGGGHKAISDFATSGHNHDGRYLRWNGSAADVSAMGWGTLTAANGYTILSHASSSDGGDVGFVSKSGQIFMQLDGYYYQNEGRYRVLDTSDFTAFSNIGNQTTRITIGGITKDLKIDADKLDGIDSTGFLRYYNSNAAPSNVNIVNTSSYVWTVSTTGGSVTNATKPSGMDNAWGVIHLHTHIGNFATQLGFGGTTNRMYMRNAYNTSTFGNWQTLAFTSDIPTVTNYYWANIKVSASSNAYTTPQFGNVTICDGTNSCLYLKTAAAGAYAYLAAYNTGGQYGADVILHSGSAMILGAGESAAAMYSNNVDSLRGSENLYLTADGNIKIFVNCDSIANRKYVACFDTTGYTYFNSYINIGGHEKNASSPTYVWGSNASDNFLRSYQTSSLSVSKAANADYATCAPASANWGGTGSTTKIKVKINSATSWMLSFVVTLYQGYKATKIMISGYNYGSNYWYEPEAVLLGDSNGATSISVYFGYDSAYNLWVGFDGGSYTGVSVTDVTNGYTQISSLKGLFTISNVSSLTTLQKTITATNLVYHADYSRYVYCTSGKYLNFQWSGQSGQPTWLFGSNDGANVYVWNPSNFSVKYASSAGNADTVDGNHANAFALVGHTHNNIKGPDNRSINNNPLWFMSNKGSASLSVEFSTQGTSILGGNYTNLLTSTSWGDNSGGRPVQIATGNAGLTIRTSKSDTEWNTWASGNIYAGNFYTASDIRYKHITQYLNINIKQLALIPIFNFIWTDIQDDKEHTGTSAQEVQKILPNIVTESEKLTVDYATLGTIAGITACKELVNQKSEIDLLKERIKELEQQLKMINDYGRC